MGKNVLCQFSSHFNYQFAIKILLTQHILLTLSFAMKHLTFEKLLITLNNVMQGYKIPQTFSIDLNMILILLYKTFLGRFQELKIIQ